MNYFAYGSNMCRERLLARVPSAVFGAVARLDGHRIRFDKRSWKDGTGKATIHLSPGDEVWGVLVSIPDSDRHLLDAAEGLGQGYDHLTVTVQTTGGDVVPAWTYIAHATHLDPRLTPLDWYVELVLIGARQQNLPGTYVRKLERSAGLT